MAATPGTVEPHAQPRRSFVYRKLLDMGAHFAPINGGSVAMSFGDDVEDEASLARRLGIADLSPLPRTGFKGTGSVDWLQSQDVTIGPESNRGYRQAGGETALRLAPSEILLVDSLAGSGNFIGKLNAAWSWGTSSPRKPIGYPMPRADSHAWFAISGQHSAEMFAKICGIDLRPSKFAEGSIAQTSIAKMSGIILRQDFGQILGFHLLADSASADYLWDCLQDAMIEFDGGPIGLAVLRGLG
jgi:sarcosine oxidase, subunit gamma